jgi:hypothetical protein
MVLKPSPRWRPHHKRGGVKADFWGHQQPGGWYNHAGHPGKDNPGIAGLPCRVAARCHFRGRLRDYFLHAFF